MEELSFQTSQQWKLWLDASGSLCDTYNHTRSAALALPPVDFIIMIIELRTMADATEHSDDITARKRADARPIINISKDVDG